jgi:hypothetical protein
VSAKFRHRITLAVVGFAAGLSSACGDLVTQGRSPAQLAVVSLQAASGARPQDLASTLLSDVITTVQTTVGGQQVSVPTVFNDVGEATFALVLKDPGDPVAPAAPSSLNQITISRYHVAYRRTDGHNTPGVDVPFPFDSAVTLTVPADGTATTGFQIVRHAAKQEAPLAALGANPDIISTIAEVTFYGRDQVGNDVTATGTIGIDFGNFADPE